MVTVEHQELGPEVLEDTVDQDWRVLRNQVQESGQNCFWELYDLIYCYFVL